MPSTSMALAQMLRSQHARWPVFTLAGIGLLDAGIALSAGALQAREATSSEVFLTASTFSFIGGSALVAFGTVLRALARQSGEALGGLRPARWQAAVQAGTYLTILLFAATWMLWNYRVDRVMTWPDTRYYVAVASEPLHSPSFWAGSSPPVLPLRLKAFSITNLTYAGPFFPALARRFTQFQSIVSLLAFGLLGASLASRLRRGRLKPVVLLVTLGFSLTVDVSQWNKMLMSESLSTSIFALLLAGAIQLVGAGEGPEDLGWKVKAALGGVMAIGILIFAFTRDVNAYIVLGVGALTIPPLLFSAIRRGKEFRAYLFVAAVAFLVWALHSTTHARSGRWAYSFNNLFFDRIAPDPAALAFFVAHGFPVHTWETIQPDDLVELQVAYRSDPRAEPLRAWFAAKARETYVKFILSRPLESLLPPHMGLASLLSPDTSSYRVRIHPEPGWFSPAKYVLYPSSPALLSVWFAAVTGAVTALMRSGKGRRVWAVPTLILALLYPLTLAVWHGDSAGLPRHILPVGLALGLSLWLLTFMVLDVITLRPRSPESRSQGTT